MKKDFLNAWSRAGTKVDVALLSAPFCYPAAASVALSTFKSELAKEKITSSVIYASFLYIRTLGTDVLKELAGVFDFTFLGEYLFSHLTDIPVFCSPEEYVDKYEAKYGPFPSEAVRAYIIDLLKQGKEAADAVVEAAARRIINTGAHVVAASSVFSQQNGSLAILKRVKELDPSIRTLMGGFNTNGEMGMTVLGHYPSADYVSFGEGDETIAQVCSILLGREEGPMPYGILASGASVPEEGIPFRVTQDMNRVAFPDYSDYFEEVKREEEGFYGNYEPYYNEIHKNVILLEGSRGCWWGQKHPCSFCALNGLAPEYREKSPEKIYEQIRMLERLYPGKMIQMTDNILSQNMIRILAPMLAADQEEHRIFAEEKANLTSREVELLSKAGIRSLQPGIESFNDHLLELMGKGCSAVQNAAFLKYCASNLAFPHWNLMVHIPGEEAQDYIQMMELFPLLVHLTPPTRDNPVIITRYSCYADDPEKYGLVLEPDARYECAFPQEEDIIRNMCAYYDLAGGPFRDTMTAHQDVYAGIRESVRQWRSLYYSDSRPVLNQIKNILGIFIFDSRPCAVHEQYTLIGLTARVYDLVWEPVSFNGLCDALPDVPADEIQKVLDYLVDMKLAIFLSGKYLGLAVR